MGGGKDDAMTDEEYALILRSEAKRSKENYSYSRLRAAGLALLGIAIGLFIGILIRSCGIRWTE